MWREKKSFYCVMLMHDAASVISYGFYYDFFLCRFYVMLVESYVCLSITYLHRSIWPWAICRTISWLLDNKTYTFIYLYICISCICKQYVLNLDHFRVAMVLLFTEPVNPLFSFSLECTNLTISPQYFSSQHPFLHKTNVLKPLSCVLSFALYLHIDFILFFSLFLILSFFQLSFFTCIHPSYTYFFPFAYLFILRYVNFFFFLYYFYLFLFFNYITRHSTAINCIYFYFSIKLTNFNLYLHLKIIKQHLFNFYIYFKLFIIIKEKILLYFFNHKNINTNNKNRVTNCLLFFFFNYNLYIK